MLNIKYNIFWRRIGARLIDGFILAGIGFLGLIFGSINNILGFLWFWCTLFMYPVYSFWFHYRYGQTIGKTLMKIEVKSISGEQLSLWQALIRETLVFVIIYLFQILRAIDNPVITKKYLLIIALINVFLWIIECIVLFINKQRRTLHDLIAKTIVIKIE